MPKYTRLAALLLTASLFPVAGASAQGVYNPYPPYTPPVTPGPGNPQEGEVPLTPRDVAEDVYGDVVEELAALNLKSALSSRRPVRITIAVNGAGTYSVRLRRKVTRRLTITLASGSVKVKAKQPDTRTVKLRTTAVGRAYMSRYRGDKIKLSVRTGFKPQGAKRTTFWTKNTTVDVKAISSDD